MPATNNTQTIDAPAATGRLLSIQVGQLETLSYRGKDVKTGIFKRPVEGPVMVRQLNLDGDVQADLRVHGGVDKAVYLYPSEHYESWRTELERDLPYGYFGENLTISGLLEEAIHIDDVIAVGEVLLQVTQPRSPCFKLGTKIGDMRFLRRFLASGRSGFYCKVLREGFIEAGQEISVVSTAPENPTISEVFRSWRES